MSTSLVTRPALNAVPLRGFTGGRSGDSVHDIHLGPPGRCAEEPTLVMLGFDGSASVLGGNDVIGQRFEEASLALHRVGRACRCGQELGAVLHFDRPTSACVPPTPIDKHGLPILEKGLVNPPDRAGRSELAKAHAEAVRLAAAHPEHRAVLVVFSDFELFDSPSVVDQLPDFPGSVHAVVLRATPPPVLVDDPRVTVTRIGLDAERGAVARALFDALLTHRRPSKRGGGR